MKKKADSGRACWRNVYVAKLFLILCLEIVGKNCSYRKSSVPCEDISLALKNKRSIYFRVSQLKIRWRNKKLRYKACSKLVSVVGNTYYDPIVSKVNWREQQWEEYLKVRLLLLVIKL
ncbi:hypothetical protein M9H77_27354 [Catharanthus roseus]|uniref:Uncharacterized protein n=1 Tax=Catharanthus roseus TaxID=4058 RepID=A0ACC0AGD6_CATRO|nr:hypothetical protein M9H77_27354 [Catharanthus roseus]